MDSILRIEGDPASWVLQDADHTAVVQELSHSDPVALQVVAPLRGRLVLSPRSAGSVALFNPPGGIGWVPSDIKVPTALLYVPSATGPTKDAPGYALAPGADLGTLEQRIVAAMREGSVLTVEVSDRLGSGVLTLNGAALLLVVLCPAAPRG
jgi:hypothetical protein